MNPTAAAEPGSTASVPTRPLDPMTLPLQGLQVIEASAGTGKTWTLAALYVRLVLGHQRHSAQGAAGLYPPQILVMTFTDAATAELRGRIRNRLAQAACFFRETGPEAAGDAFLHQVRAAYVPDQWPACAQRLDLAAQWMDEAAIYTLHGWSSRMLRQHAFDSASLFQQTRVEDGERLQLIAVQDYWRQWFYPLPQAQLAALRSLGDTPEAFLTVLQARWAVADRAPQAAQFAGEAPDALLPRWSLWQETRDALQALARVAWTPQVVASVSEAVARKAIKGVQQKWLQGWLRQMDLWAQGEPIDLKTLERFSVTVLQEKGWAEAGRHIVFAHIDALCAHLRAEPDVAEGLQAHAAHTIGQAYREAKARLAQFDFSDLLQHLYHALQAPDGRLAAAIRQQYPVALVDEFQDTDPWQYGALSRIYGESADPGNGLIMIGDPKQAIYSFRGADLGTYLRARGDAQAVHTLAGNYRSTAGVVAAVNHVFAHASRPFGAVPFAPVEASNPDVQPLQLAGGAQPAMTVWHLHRATPLRKPEFLRQMAEMFATQMVALLQQGAATPSRAGQDCVEPGHMAVLVRGWREAAAMRQALAARGVRSVYLSERDSVYATPEATDLWRILRAVANPRATAHVRAALATRVWGLPWDGLEALLQDERAWEGVVEQFHHWQNLWQRQGLLPMLHHLLHAQGIPARLMQQDPTHSRSGERQLTNLLHLGDLLQAASLRLQGEGALIRHLEEQLRHPAGSGDVAQLRLESDANLVQVITVHKSKGLQYPLVFLPFVSAFREEGRDSGSDDALRLEEDIRLLYVALTRAEKAIWLGLTPLAGDADGATPRAKSAVSALLGRQSPYDLADCLTTWQACADIVVAEAPPSDALRFVSSHAPRVYKPVAVPARRLRGDWWTASFSALVAHTPQTAEPAWPATRSPDSERDSRLADAQWDAAVPVEPDPVPDPVGDLLEGLEPLPTYNDFPAGSAYGTLLHDLLEWQAEQGWPAAQPGLPDSVAAEWGRLLSRKTQRLTLAADEVARLNTWVAAIVGSPLPLPPVRHSGSAVPPLRLASLTREHIWPEMGFALMVHGTPARQLDRLIQQHVLRGQQRPPLQDRQLDGMLIGFMDLVLAHEGRYYVLDYKSNRLAGYGRAQLQAAILAHRYDVQATLYLLALHRLLRSRLPDYNYEQHVGGALYVFLRGVDQPGAGLYADRPPQALIEALDGMLRKAAS